MISGLVERNVELVSILDDKRGKRIGVLVSWENEEERLGVLGLVCALQLFFFNCLNALQVLS